MENWIKVRAHLHEQREIRLIAKALSIPDLHAVGLMVRFWGWCDSNTADGVIVGLAPDDVDAMVGCPGFAKAAKGAGWLEWDNEKIVVPNYINHNGVCSKRRADAAKRQSKGRET